MSASDTFGLGVTLYEALSATMPFSEGDPQPLGELADVPEALEAIVMRSLARDPNRRPRTAVEAAIALERVLEGLGTEEPLRVAEGVEGPLLARADSSLRRREISALPVLNRYLVG